MLAAKISIFGNVIAIFFFTLILAGCIPETDEIVDQCQMYFDEQADKLKDDIIQQCTIQCNNTIAQIEAKLAKAQEALIQALKEEFGSELESKELEIMAGLGCTILDDSEGCTGID